MRGDNMARPAKAMAVSTQKISKEERENREETEKKIKGKSNKLKPPKYLNDRQKKVFKFILNELKESDILGNLDVFVLSQTAIAIERLESLEKQANEDASLLISNSFKSTRDMYSKDFFRCCNELCLSPQARAKISIVGAKDAGKDKKSIMDILGDDEDD